MAPKRSYRFNEKTQQMEEISNDWTDAPRRAATATEGIVYGNVQATDGTPLDTRKKHREYMERNGLAMESDFTQTRAKAAAEREAFFRGESTRETAERTEQVGRAAYELSKNRNRRRR